MILPDFDALVLDWDKGMGRRNLHDDADAGVVLGDKAHLWGEVVDEVVQHVVL